jgi:two-component system sensor histidine kinase UhpB
MKHHPLRSLWGDSVWRDLSFAAAAALLVAVLASATELNELIFEYTRRWETYQLDEWPTVLLAFALCMVTLYARRHAQLQRALAENRHLLARLIDVQEQERRRLARELHDELGQTLNAIKLDALALPATAQGADLATLAQRIAHNADHVYQAAGDLVRHLRPPALDELGLVDALEACVDRWRRSHPALVVQLSTGVDLDDLGETRNLAIYRLVQEALTNCVRHARATHFFIDLARALEAGGRILLEMRDDGAGFDVKTLPGGGSGLAGMRERVTLLRGRFELLSQPGRGTTVRVEIPPP